VGRRAVFLDRDGVLNAAVVRGGVPYPPSDADEVEVLPGVEEACRSLREAGFELVVVTNQPDIARGTQTPEAVQRINQALLAALPLDAVMVCPHDDADGCACRKPKPGMLVEAARSRGIDLAASFMVGDRWRDVEAGVRAGCGTVFVDRGYDEPSAHPDVSVSDLGEAAKWILEMGEGASGD
jgi:D-glycero-D-manno-heptose 1,7-bisphosphate phosphatase